MAVRSRDFGRCDYIAGVILEHDIGTATLADGTNLRTLPVREVAPQQDVQGTGLDNVPRWYRIPDLDLLPPKPIENSNDIYYVLCQDENEVTSFTDLSTESQIDWNKATGFSKDNNQWIWASSPHVYVYNMSAVGDGPGFWKTTRPQPVHAWGPVIYASQVGLKHRNYIPPALTPSEKLDDHMWRRAEERQDIPFYNAFIRFEKSNGDPLGVFNDNEVSVGAYMLLDSQRPNPFNVVIGPSQAATFKLGGDIWFDGPNYMGFTGNPAIEYDPIGLYDVHGAIRTLNRPPRF